MAPIRNGRPGTIRPALSIQPTERPHAPPYFLWFRPFADNEADQIRTYVVRDTYRQGALCPSI